VIHVAVAVESDSILCFNEVIDVDGLLVSESWNDTHESTEDWDNEEKSSKTCDPSWPVSLIRFLLGELTNQINDDHEDGEEWDEDLDDPSDKDRNVFTSSLLQKDIKLVNSE